MVNSSGDRPRLVEIRRKKRNESEISHSIVHALSARGRLRWFSFLPAVCLHLDLYVRCGAVLDRCGPIGSDVVISRTVPAIATHWRAGYQQLARRHATDI